MKDCKGCQEKQKQLDKAHHQMNEASKAMSDAVDALQISNKKIIEQSLLITQLQGELGTKNNDMLN